MEILYIIVIFVIVSFLYIHTMNQFKTSDDLEVYEFDYIDNMNLQETCDVLQPVIFKRKKQLILPCLDNYKQLLNLKDSLDYYKDFDSIQSIELPCKSLLELLGTDTAGHYFSENNKTFIAESGILKNLVRLDDELQPKFCLQSNYDILFGSENTSTPLRFHTNTRKYLYALNSSIKVKMCSQKFTKYLHLIKDYENLEFFSQINCWTTDQLYQEYTADLEQIQFLEFDLPMGHILYIPKYWWYSIKFIQSGTQIIEYNYSTLINKMAHFTDSVKFYLQNQNVVGNFTKSVDMTMKDTQNNEEVTSDMNEID
jgi:hypothetical protein